MGGTSCKMSAIRIVEPPCRDGSAPRGRTPVASAAGRGAEPTALIYKRLNSAVQALASWSVACRRGDSSPLSGPGLSRLGGRR